MTQEKLNLLKSKLQNFPIEYSDVKGTPAITVNKENILEVCRILKEDDALKFNQLVDAVSVDRFSKKNRFEMIYNIISIENNYRLFIKIKLFG